MQELTKKPPTEKMIEVKFRGTIASINELRKAAKALQIIDISDQFDDRELFSPEELSPELLTNRGGVCIRGGRGKEGLTQKQLAELSGIAQHHISEMENGKRPIGKETAKKLAAVLKVDYRVFL